VGPKKVREKAYGVNRKWQMVAGFFVLALFTIHHLRRLPCQHKKNPEEGGGFFRVKTISLQVA